VQHRRAGRWETDERLGFHTGRQMSSNVPSDVVFGDAQVWLVDLCASDERYGRAFALLSHDERARARAIRGEQGARRFVLARGALRVRLGHALAIAPEHVTLRVGEHGKPELAPPPPGAAVGTARVSQGLPRFNLAHRDGVALLTIHPRHHVGIDVERIAPESKCSWSKLLERICHPSEAREAINEARAIGSRAFYERWVGKEAVLKALGLGLSVSPTEVGLHRDGDGVLRVGELPGRQGAAAGPLRLATVRTPAGYVGALALLG
jgi:phosphopantetheinyl transferase